jgi:putative transposase
MNEIYEKIVQLTKRGLFKSATGQLINADINGACNILRKAFPTAFSEGIEGISVYPIRVNFV